MPRPGTSQRRRHNCRTPFKASPDRGGEYAAAPRLGDAKIADVIFQQRSLIDAQVAQVAAETELAAARAQLDLTLGTLK